MLPTTAPQPATINIKISLHKHNQTKPNPKPAQKPALKIWYTENTTTTTKEENSISRILSCVRKAQLPSESPSTLDRDSPKE